MVALRVLKDALALEDESNMPQLLLLVLAGAGLAVGYRWYVRESKSVAEALREAEAALNRGEQRRVETLERDSETGVYRPSSGRKER